jgi:glycosyltransferase involved in cell wall biosynthesis
MPGCRKAVVDGETGFIVPPQDAVALSEALSELLSDPSMRRQMGRQGRELVEEKFDKRVITEKYLDVYREMGLDL